MVTRLGSDLDKFSEWSREDPGGEGAVCVSCDYEVRVPADLQVQFDGATESIDIFNELE